MSKENSATGFMTENRNYILAIILVITFLELIIYWGAASHGGRKAWLQILDGENGAVIYETRGDTLTEFDKYYFEHTFGPVTSYPKQLITRNEPFPFRAWFSAAVGIPVCLILIMAFAIRAYTSLFYERGEQATGIDSTREERDGDITSDLSPMEKWVHKVSGFNIFTIGFLVFLAVFLYWVVPNIITYTSKAGLEFILTYKWFFLSVLLGSTALFVWMIFMRYLLAKKAIEAQTEIRKYKIAIAYQHGIDPDLPLPVASKSLIEDKAELIDQDADDVVIVSEDDITA